MVQGQKNNYLNTVIYKIVCNDLTIKSVYVGHTTNWIQRKYSHKSDCNNEIGKRYNSYVYQFIRANGGWENLSMIEIFKFPCADKREAEAEERRQMENLNADLNSIRPIVTENEHNEQHKESSKEYNHKNKEKRREYRKKNQEQIKQKQREYQEKNKEKINQQRRERRRKKKLSETVVIL